MLYFLAFLTTSIVLCRSGVITDEGLICSCNDVLCQETGNCALGEVKGVCECCNECARVRNEPCGGMYNYAGICGAGLKCEPNDFKQLPGICIPEK
uniref:Venom protein n=1 Tax=Hadrurus spadix TaxID=141984 RepID=A0A1W7R945_9SCOR